MKTTEKSSKKELIKSPELFLPIIICFSLVAICKLALALLPKINNYAVVSLLILLIFAIPTFVSLRLDRKKDPTPTLRQRLSLNAVRPEHIFLVLAGALLMMSASVLLNICFRGASSSTSFTLYSAFAAVGNGSKHTVLYISLTYAIIPAVCEELFFRGALSGTKSFSSVIVRSLLYAMLPFDPTLLPSSLLCGLVLSFILIITRSVVACISAHLLLNLFQVFIGTNISAYYLSSGNNALLVTVLVLVLLLSCAFFCGEAARIFKGYAKADVHFSDVIQKEKASAVLKNTVAAIVSPLGIACIVLYAAVFALGLII